MPRPRNPFPQIKKPRKSRKSPYFAFATNLKTVKRVFELGNESGPLISEQVILPRNVPVQATANVSVADENSDSSSDDTDSNDIEPDEPEPEGENDGPENSCKKSKPKKPYKKSVGSGAWVSCYRRQKKKKPPVVEIEPVWEPEEEEEPLEIEIPHNPDPNCSTPCYYCMQCMYTFYSAASYEEHWRTRKHITPAPFLECPQCEFKCILLTSLEEHMKDHVLSCKVCNLNFETTEKGKEHLERHKVADDKFECLICKDVMDNQVALQAHKCAPLSFKCKVCGSTYNSKKGLANHIDVHKLKEQFTCKICSQQFPTKGQYEQHWRQHSHELPFGCNKCDFSCAEVSDLKQHLASAHP